jgi:hypothetical protein
MWRGIMRKEQSSNQCDKKLCQGSTFTKPPNQRYRIL